MPGDPVLRVVSLNIGSLFEPDWDRRRFEIVAWLERLDPDVVCLQEVQESEATPNTAGWIVDELAARSATRWHWQFGGGSFDPVLWPDASMRFGSAVLSRWPIDAHTYHRLPIAAGIAGLVDRMPWELLHVATAGLDLFSTHLAAAPTDGLHRIEQVLAIDDLVRSARGTKDVIAGFGHRREAMPAIVCGDFNAEPDSDEIRFLCGLTPLVGRTTFFQDAFRIAGDGPGLTQDWRSNPIAGALNVHRKRIDYVFVGDPFTRLGNAGRVLHAEVAFEEPITGIVASDHAGLVVDITWPSRPV